jgi:hypothetical protein
MKTGLKSLVAAAVLAVSSAPAFAIDGATTGNSALFITVFDTVKGASVIQDLGPNYNDYAPALVTGEGFTQSFNIDLSVFSTVGSLPSNIRYTVFAADATGLFGSTGALITAPVGLPTITGTNGNVTGMYGPSGSIQVTSTINGAPNCGPAAIVCTGTDFGGTYFGGGAWGPRFGSFLSVDGSEQIGNALGFYKLGRTSNTSVDPMSVVQYANVNGPATWLLNSAGVLTFSSPGGQPPVIPLPAAVWLLLSGLAGMGLIGRRKAAV